MSDGVLPFPSVPVADVQGTLALDLAPRQDPPASAARTTPGADVIAIDARRRLDVEAWAARFAQAAVEIVGGDRPASQLVRWTSAVVQADLERRAQMIARAGGHAPGQARVQPVRPKVVGVRISFVAEWVVEAAVRVRYGERSRALAARFERIQSVGGDRWVCTALEWA